MTRRVSPIAAAVALLMLVWMMPRWLDDSASAAADRVDEINCNFGDDATSLWIHYRMLDGEIAINAVSYGADASYGKTATARAPAITPVDRSGVFREAHLTGLRAGERVHYRIGSGGLDHTCRTPPAGNFRWDDIGDTGTTLCTPWASTTHALVAADAPDFVTHGGDIAYANACGVRAVHRYYLDQQVWSTKAAFQPAWGNHEYEARAASAPAGTPRDRLANYKGRSTVTHAQTLNSDGPFRASAPGCPPRPGTTMNSCRGEDWGWFRVSGVLFISYPEPWPGALSEWRGKARALMLGAESNPAIDFIVTYGHRPAYSSRPKNGAQADVRAAIDALGNEFGAAAGGKYVLNVGHHTHGEEAFSARHGVVHLTNGGGGEGQSKLTTAPGLVFKSRHPGYLTADYSALTHTLRARLRCGPRFGTGTADPCTQGSTLYSVTFSSR